MISPSPLALRDSLERRYDGPIPPADPTACLVSAAQRARLFQRLVNEAREQTAYRRVRLAAAKAPMDERLHRLSRDLCLYRHQGLLWLRP